MTAIGESRDSSTTLTQLRAARCIPIARGTPALDEQRSTLLLDALNGWRLDAGALVKRFRFRDYCETIAFVNLSAWLSHREDHHPELVVGYDECRVAYLTHSIGGLSENDFICAAKLDALLEP